MNEAAQTKPNDMQDMACVSPFPSHEQLQQEIERQRRLTEKVIDALPLSIYVVDRDLVIVAWNRNREIGEQGINRQAVIGRRVTEVFSRMSAESLLSEFDEVFATGQPLRFERESVLDGETRHWVISKIPMCIDGAAGQVTHVVTLGEEITDQKKLNETIIHAEKLTGIGRLASGVVHEINNPLATIAACASALQSRLAEAPDLPAATRADFAEYLKIIHDESFRCKSITNGLLDFSRQRQAEKSPLELDYLIDQTIMLVRHHPRFGALRIVREHAGPQPLVFANEGQLKQVFIAMISNACDAMETPRPGGHTLTIRAGQFMHKGKTLAGVEIIDTGCGISPETIPRIFEPFFTTKPFGQGTGLGLAVCYGIVSDHQGFIEVESEPGSGATMRVLLPPYKKGE
ncbi:MAG: two-component system sensor histidine kinase NtrB [Blastocatellia bacterium]